MNRIKSNVKHNRFHTKFLNLCGFILKLDVRVLFTFFRALLLLLLLLHQSLSLRPLAHIKILSLWFLHQQIIIISHKLYFQSTFLMQEMNARKRIENVLKWYSSNNNKSKSIIIPHNTNYTHTLHRYNIEWKCGYHRLFKRHKLLTHLPFIFIDLKTATPHQ